MLLESAQVNPKEKMHVNNVLLRLLLVHHLFWLLLEPGRGASSCKHCRSRETAL
jgi:hypothetical protein